MTVQTTETNSPLSVNRPSTIDLFITHAWRYHDEWTGFSNLMDQELGLEWRNFSLPWHDPAIKPNSEFGGVFLRSQLENQIIPAHAVILLFGVYQVESARGWVNIELDSARKHGKPIIGIPPKGATEIPEELGAMCSTNVFWNVEEIIRAVNALRTSES